MTRLRGLVLLLACAFVTSAASAEDPAAAAAAARADIKQTLGFVPGFLDQVPDNALPGAWEEMKTLQLNPSTALPARTKELISLAVAAQIPCKYCVYAHTEFATLNEATKEQLDEAVVMSSLTRHWSTVLHGQQTDLASFRAMLKQALQHVQKQADKQKSQQPAAPTPPGAMMSADAAYEEIRQVFGSVPDFLAKFPREGIAGAWREMRDVQLNPRSALSQKEKSLIGVAVASQVPCRFCLAFDTEFAKMAGATQRELSEAVAMAAITRHWSTMLNGQQTDENAFRRDIDRIVRNAKKQPPQQPGVARAQPEPARRRGDKAAPMSKGDAQPMRGAPASSAKTQAQSPAQMRPQPPTQTP